MSAQFYPAHETGRPLVRCTCEAFDAAPLSCPACQLTLDLNERNWRDLLEYLGLPVECCGKIEAPRLAGVCRVRLAQVEIAALVPSIGGGGAALDAGIPMVERRGSGGCHIIEAGRDAGYLRERTVQLLKIALAAGDGWIAWS